MDRVLRTTLALLPILALGRVSPSFGQGITRDTYIDYLPPRPPIVAETRATALLQLYGDARNPEYYDGDPVDGVDDVRGRRTLEIGEISRPCCGHTTAACHATSTQSWAAPTLHIDSGLEIGASRRTRSFWCGTEWRR